jgi:Transcriptional regulators
VDIFEEKLDTLLTDTYNSISKFEEKTLRESGINATISEVHLIEVVGKQQQSTISSLARNLGITMASVTIAVNKLSDRGFIIKEKNPGDKRSVHLSLTKQGLRVYRLHRYFHRLMVREVVAGLKSAEKEIIYKTVERLNNFFKKSSSGSEK